MQSICSADGRGLEGSKTEFFLSLEAPPVPEEAPGKSFENQRGPPRWPQARFTAFLQGAVAPSMKAKKLPKKVFKLDTFLKKAVSKFEVDRRLQSLHFKDVF